MVRASPGGAGEPGRLDRLLSQGGDVAYDGARGQPSVQPSPLMVGTVPEGNYDSVAIHASARR